MATLDEQAKSINDLIDQAQKQSQMEMWKLLES